MAKKHVLIAVIVIVIAAVSIIFFTQNLNTKSGNIQTQQTETKPKQTSSELTSASGRYIAYSETDRSDSNFKQTLLFFHAAWCPQCRAFDKNISNGSIPEGTQILKVDYDSNQSLKKQYGVTLQTTFVSVKPSGEQINKWVGYTSNHTLEALLNEFGS